MIRFLRGAFVGACLALFALPALAGTGTITVLDSGGTTRTYDVVTDGSGHYVGMFALCDQSAAAQCQSVDANNAAVSEPFATTANRVSGEASATGTSATTIIAAGAAGIKNYITSLQCFRTDAGTTAAYVTLDDAKSTVIGLPNNGGGGGNNVNFAEPIATAAATAFTFTASGSISTIYCSAQGYTGS